MKHWSEYREQELFTGEGELLIEDMPLRFQYWGGQDAEWILADEKMVDDYDLAKRLLEWFNIRKPTFFDLKLLKQLSDSGRFIIIDCDICGETLIQGSPDNWDRFQGVMDDEYAHIEINGRDKVVCGECYGTNPLLN